MPVYDLHPGMDSSYNFPPEIRLALSESDEIRHALISEFSADSTYVDALLKEVMEDPDSLTSIAIIAIIAQAIRVGPQNLFAGRDAASVALIEAEYGVSNDSGGGYQNTFLGALSGNKNYRGWKNTGVGYGSLRYNVDGYNNVGIGDMALERNVGGVGDSSPSGNDPGTRNTGVGSYALRYNTSGRGNVGMGRNSGHANTTGNYNTSIGTNAYSGSISNDVGVFKTASGNVAVGYNAAFSTNADDNVAVGNHALYRNVIGVENVAIGTLSATYVNSNYNVAIGGRSMRNNTGNSNIAIGTAAHYTAGTGSRNTVIGTSAYYAPEAGGSNVIVGYEAGTDLTAGTNYATAIGTQAKADHSNSVALGYDTKTTDTYQFTFGERSMYIPILPTEKMSVQANPAGVSLWVDRTNGKTALKIRFGTGSIQTIATEV